MLIYITKYVLFKKNKIYGVDDLLYTRAKQMNKYVPLKAHRINSIKFIDYHLCHTDEIR